MIPFLTNLENVELFEIEIEWGTARLELALLRDLRTKLRSAKKLRQLGLYNANGRFLAQPDLLTLLKHELTTVHVVIEDSVATNVSQLLQDDGNFDLEQEEYEEGEFYENNYLDDS